MRSASKAFTCSVDHPKQRLGRVAEAESGIARVMQHSLQDAMNHTVWPYGSTMLPSFVYITYSIVHPSLLFGTSPQANWCPCRSAVCSFRAFVQCQPVEACSDLAGQWHGLDLNNSTCTTGIFSGCLGSKDKLWLFFVTVWLT